MEGIKVPSKDKFLTQDEVDALPTRAKIGIIWSGGNGPAIREIINYGGTAWDKDSVTGEMNCPITFAGKEKMHDNVWLISGGM